MNLYSDHKGIEWVVRNARILDFTALPFLSSVKPDALLEESPKPFIETDVEFFYPKVLLGNDHEFLYSGLFAWLTHCGGGLGLSGCPYLETWDTFVVELFMERTMFDSPSYYVRSASETGEVIELLGTDEYGDIVLFDDFDCGRLNLKGWVQLLYRSDDSVKRQLIDQIVHKHRSYMSDVV